MRESQTRLLKHGIFCLHSVTKEDLAVWFIRAVIVRGNLEEGYKILAW
jgi:hypothetical protein